MIDRIEREAAVRYIREKLGDVARISVAVNNILHVMQNERRYPLTDAMCDLVKHLVKQNSLLMEQNLSLQSVVGKVAPHWGESAVPAGKYQKCKTLRLGSFEEEKPRSVSGPVRVSSRKTPMVIGSRSASR
jgi:hypothetical protein